jgi:hypothetical protein
MKRIELLYRKYFNIPGSVPSRVIYVRLVMWLILFFVLGIVLGRMLFDLTLIAGNALLNTNNGVKN